jgi:hypothetical protein
LTGRGSILYRSIAIEIGRPEEGGRVAARQPSVTIATIREPAHAERLLRGQPEVGEQARGVLDRARPVVAALGADGSATASWPAIGGTRVFDNADPERTSRRQRRTPDPQNRRASTSCRTGVLDDVKDASLRSRR